MTTSNINPRLLTGPGEQGAAARLRLVQVGVGMTSPRLHGCERLAGFRGRSVISPRFSPLEALAKFHANFVLPVKS